MRGRGRGVRACVQAVACSGVNLHILRSLNTSSEVSGSGHKAPERGISCPASCCTQLLRFPCIW